MANENCLENMRCPKCGHEDAFRIGATVLMRVHDDGTDKELSGYEWDHDSFCACEECDHFGTVGDFIFTEGERDAE
ncbi:MAG: hypothetical protein JW384_02036 [Nitrosomonadaceae bacterium]|nr:hypothetical protein [Nitrosomonadaceae bacterium]